VVRGVQPGSGGRRHRAEGTRLTDLAEPALDAGGVTRALDLRPHPKGGHYRETFRDVAADGAATAILFLLADHTIAARGRSACG
jgi:hypothetical protein